MLSVVLQQTVVMTGLCPPRGTAVTLLTTVLRMVIIGLILRMRSGKLHKQNKGIWWQINDNDVTILVQYKVRPHLTQISISCSLLVICGRDLI